jgi:anti-sigma factor RsiW
MMQHDRGDAGDVGIPSTGAPCARLREAAWSYLDDESPWWERQRIRAHLAECPHCRAYLQFLRGFLRVLRAEFSRDGADDTLRRRVRRAPYLDGPSSE